MTRASRAVFLSAVFVLGAAALARSTGVEAVLAREPLATFPARIGDWTGQSAPEFDSKVLAVLGADEYVNRIYSSQERIPFSLYIGYYASQRLGDTIHSPMNCLPGNGWEPVTTGRLTIAVPMVGAGTMGAAGHTRSVIEVNRVIIEKGIDRQLVLYWYQSRNRVIASDYWGKVYKFVDAIRLNRTDGALVRVITPIGDSENLSEARTEQRAARFTQALFPLLGRYLPP